MTFSAGAASAQEASVPGQPGLFSGTTATHTDAVIEKIDMATNTLTLRKQDGSLVDVVVDKTVGNVSRLHIGDHVAITYTRALILSAERAAEGAIRERLDTQTVTPASGGMTKTVHRVQAVATVLAIDRGRRLLTLRGPSGPMTLQAATDRFLEGLQVGENIRVDYIEGTALEVTRDGVPVR
ncbi:hypothetical protein GWC77_24545 [Paraburkholderia sp. NMBU_R16]|nr:hypothetical protein [Paraburkholderia sp. NMBU_R16]NRO99074.1 hypothetical protein [Paraburkholderia sp. NMBU_R16]